MNTNGSSKDPVLVTALKVLEDEGDLERISVLKSNLIQNIRHNRIELVKLMINEDVKIIDNSVARISLNNSRFVQVLDLNEVPGEFLVSLGYRVNKRQIHRLGVCPRGTVFGNRNTVHILRK